MAKLILRSDGGRAIVDLPSVCMACGAPATVRKNKTFSWYPPWISVFLFVGGPLIFIILALVLTKRQKVETPLCERHTNYWWLQPLIMGFALLGFLVLGFFTLFAMDNGNGGSGNLGAAMCGATILGLVVLLIVVAVMTSMRIRPTEITDRAIKLTSVSEAFVDAVEADEYRQRSAFDRMDDYRSDPRRSVKEDDDDRYTRRDPQRPAKEDDDDRYTR